jgi:CMP/dCMP kinase
MTQTSESFHEGTEKVSSSFPSGQNTPQRTPRMIAVDGPAASGKSTVAEKLAEYLHYLYFDTGLMYRAVTWAALKMFGGVEDEKQVSNLAHQVQIDVRSSSIQDGRKCDVLVDHQDVTWEIRKPEVDANVSQVSVYPGVRQALTEQQRRIGLRGQVVMAGRDIGTVVLPEAELKIYLEASAEERARRRYQEITGRGETASFEAILEGLKRRDQIDSTRAIAPLRPAEDAHIIDTDSMSANQVLEKILAMLD